MKSIDNIIMEYADLIKKGESLQSQLEAIMQEINEIQDKKKSMQDLMKTAFELKTAFDGIDAEKDNDNLDVQTENEDSEEDGENTMIADNVEFTIPARPSSALERDVYEYFKKYNFKIQKYRAKCLSQVKKNTINALVNRGIIEDDGLGHLIWG